MTRAGKLVVAYHTILSCNGSLKFDLEIHQKEHVMASSQHFQI